MNEYEIDPSRKYRDPLEEQLRKFSQDFPYPPTPDLATRWSQIEQLRRSSRPGLAIRRPAWVAAAILIVLALLFSVPSVRAQILEFIQIGVVRIFLVEPTPVPSTIPGLPTSTPLPVDLVQALREIAGETSLAVAAQEVDYPVKLLAYPPSLGKPDHVFVQDMGRRVLILVWMDRTHPDRSMFSLSFIPSGSYALDKFNPVGVQETTVNGQKAYWTQGPYILRLKNGDSDLRRIVEGNALIWVDGMITYRLETSLPMEEAIKIGESLQPYSP